MAAAHEKWGSHLGPVALTAHGAQICRLPLACRRIRMAWPCASMARSTVRRRSAALRDGAEVTLSLRTHAAGRWGCGGVLNDAPDSTFEARTRVLPVAIPDV